jgi:hypothetical protein
MGDIETPDNDIPVPTKRQRNVMREPKAPLRDWASMKVGDSHFIPLPAEGNITQHQRRVSASANWWKYSNGSPFVFKTAQWAEETLDPVDGAVIRSTKGVRIWRTA